MLRKQRTTIPSERIKCGEGEQCFACKYYGSDSSGYMTKNGLNRCDFYDGPHKLVRKFNQYGEIKDGEV